MKEENECLNLINELNELIIENKFFENLGMSFSYTTNGYYDIIDFGDFNLYCSENNSLSEFDDMTGSYIDITLKKFVTTKFAILCEELFQLSQEMLKINIKNN